MKESWQELPARWPARACRSLRLEVLRWPGVIDIVNVHAGSANTQPYRHEQLALLSCASEGLTTRRPQTAGEIQLKLTTNSVGTSASSGIEIENETTSRMENKTGRKIESWDRCHILTATTVRTACAHPAGLRLYCLRTQAQNIKPHQSAVFAAKTSMGRSQLAAGRGARGGRRANRPPSSAGPYYELRGVPAGSRPRPGINFDLNTFLPYNGHE
ncbi:hypothetical protein EVAR_24852_1 [Eumeta japonica]|uniref:Uncharacterized protein n=1 Tax=Eumeta variegata TaxID=151549 RepID=A0A4C1YBG5_EUMVA|nr:hypothetical protein EVAR_24852_1 [Eumeta japonica]